MTIRDIAIAFGYEIDESSANEVEKSISGLKDTATKALAAIGVGFSLKELNEVAEEFNGINDKIRNATKGLGDQKAIQKDILDTANDIRMSYGDTADTISSLVQTSPDIFGSVDDAAKFTELTAKLFKTAGKSNEEVKALQESINKSFSKGVVDSETINQLLEQSPEAVNLLCKSLGTSKEKLTQLCTDGKISLTQLRDAFTTNEASINAGYAGLDYSISDAVLNVKNQFGLLVDDINSTWKITQRIAQAITKIATFGINALRGFFDMLKKVADKIGGTDNMLKLMGATLASVMASVLVSKGPQFLQFFSKLKKAIKGVNGKLIAIGAIVLMIILLVDDFVNFMQGNNSVIGSVFEKFGIDGDQVRETISNLGTIIKDFFKNLVEKIVPVLMDLAKDLLPPLKKIIEAVIKILPKLFEIIKKVFNILKDVGKKVLDTVIKVISNFCQNVLPILIDLFERVWPVIEKVGGMLMDILVVALDVVADLLDKTLLPAFEGIISFLEGDWDKGIQNIAESFTGSWESALGAIDSLFGTHLADWYAEVKSFWMDVGSSIYQMTHQDVLQAEELSSKYSSMQADLNSAALEALKDGKSVEEAMEYAKAKVLDTSEKVYAFDTLANDTETGFGFQFDDELLKSYQDTLVETGQIPAMARGGIVTKPTLALIGEGSEDEAVIPLSRLAATMASAASTFVARNSPGDSVSAINSTSNRNVTQNVTINNKFEGGLAAAQTKGAAAMNQSADDATAILARGLAYSR